MLTVSHLTASYGPVNIIKDLSFKLAQGEFLSIIGENGVGKTTLVRSLLGILKPRAGKIDFADNSIAHNIGYVPQSRNLDEEYPITVRDFVSLNLRDSKLPWLSPNEKAKVTSILKQTDLMKIANRPLGQASGGEKQRAYLAQALLNSPKLLILDESTASLDVEMKQELLKLVVKFQKENQTSVIFITHDLPLARRYSDSYLLMTKQQEYTTGPINRLVISESEKV
ncbi:metal ABC transporter ATP-binding protein [Paucilactobacillus nenjiangensis]|uniref:metal ABC transporter ATP-binding protein n=1 Tax=Paucilactobacillus nenjiangensis TaxID=1296540 RepID=UPI001CDBDDE6|nr:ABC transporter ATP-binding protein [Paucilactobacillus nenjiangensis]